MKKSLLTLIALVFAYAVSAQLNAQDSLALKMSTQETSNTKSISNYIKTHFSSDSARARAIFVWVANNINYDVEKLRSLNANTQKATIEEVLSTRKAVCQGYAELMIELLKECNIPALLVPGFGRMHDGSITPLSHAWVAAEVNNKWSLFDPTWSAGSVENWKFTRRFSNRFYKVSPEEMIRDHMPFDPMHQFLNYPISANDFYDGKTAINNTGKYFNYRDSLKLQNSLNQPEQLKHTIARIQSNGVRTDLIQKHIEHISKYLQSFDSRVGLDSANSHFKAAIESFNKYIKNKNDRFASAKPEEVQSMIESALQHVAIAREMLASIVPKDQQMNKIVYEMKNALHQFSQRVDQEQAFVKTYFKKS
jgi:transglutaminase/protease-like cytokinesis protein 3